MRLEVFKIIFLFSLIGFSQKKVEGTIFFNTGEIIPSVEIYDENQYLTISDSQGKFTFFSFLDEKKLFFLIDDYTYEEIIDIKKEITHEIIIDINSVNLDEVTLIANKKKSFQLRKLKDVEGTTINAGKKNEVILITQAIGNIASNNSRQIYSQIPGLNIFESDDAGIQLNIGGRGLNPNRSSNFNTRQNGYDISADVLGYPESYYTPPAESLKEIKIIRGAASLQYGTQFGGLVNFIFKEPETDKKIELLSRNTLGSNNLYTNFTSLSGKKNKISYYTFFNFKEGEGFRANSNFNSKNAFLNINYNPSDKVLFKLDFTYLKYLAKQGGGLSDKMFKDDPYQSNRGRNWFGIDWFVYNFKYQQKLSLDSTLSVSLFGLNATRNSIGFRTNRVDQIDPLLERDLINGDFNNFGAEIKYLTKYKIFSSPSTLLFGSKLYNSRNYSEQGPGSDSYDADFEIKTNEFPNYTNQSNYKYPNYNYAFFAENIFYINEKISITPGFRYEYIQTESDGYYKKINLDGAGNVILNSTIDNSEKRKRNFILLGIGFSIKPNNSIEIYSNFSENYRSVTFADISILNPAFSINPNINDENGNTFDIGIRGNFKKLISYDINFFNLNYKNRIGFVQKVTAMGNVKSEKGNVGDARISGIESLVDFNLSRIFDLGDNYIFNYYINYSYIDSKYTNSDIPGVVNKRVEFVPKNNLKTGLRFGFKDFIFSYQYSYISNQFTDSSNAIDGSLSGVIGEIPSYKISDLSASYSINKLKFELGVNNLLKEKYFTRRATGYPGPGIIPSSPLSYYLTLQIKI
jgi:Fe(3+) dicitrate transport protein